MKNSVNEIFKEYKKTFGKYEPIEEVESRQVTKHMILEDIENYITNFRNIENLIANQFTRRIYREHIFDILEMRSSLYALSYKDVKAIYNILHQYLVCRSVFPRQTTEFYETLYSKDFDAALEFETTFAFKPVEQVKRVKKKLEFVYNFSIEY